MSTATDVLVKVLLRDNTILAPLRDEFDRVRDPLKRMRIIRGHTQQKLVLPSGLLNRMQAAVLREFFEQIDWAEAVERVQNFLLNEEAVYEDDDEWEEWEEEDGYHRVSTRRKDGQGPICL